jgi:DNA-binding transcriptional ArsR family regulator
MNDELAAQCLEALGQPRRLAIYRLLVRAGDTGLAVGDIQKALNMPGSTLNHHLGFLVRAGIVDQERLGREIRCRADFDAMRRMVDYLTAECCLGVTLDNNADIAANDSN